MLRSLDVTPGHVGPITVARVWGFVHGHLHDTPLRKGDILHLELVPRFLGYSICLMRPVATGGASAEQRDDAATLLELQDAQFAAMRPGSRAAEVYAILREGVLRAGLREHYDNVTG